MSLQQMLLGAGAVATKTYVDDIFSTFVYEGNGYHPSANPSGPTSRNIVNGIDFTEGGLAIFKTRNQAAWWQWVDTENGATNSLATNSNNALDTNRPNGLKTFNNNGFTIGYDSLYNVGGVDYDYSSYSFRKAPGFFTISSWTGNGANDRAISHSLGSIPGMIIVKALNDSSPWTVYHREIGATKYLYLNDTQAAATDEWWADTTPTASNFYVQSTRTNANNTTFVAYVFAGGESTAATARSVDFDGSGDYLTTSTSSDYTIGTDDFTLECWCYQDARAWASLFDGNGSGANQFDLYLKDNGVIYHRTGSTVRILTLQNVMPVGQWAHIALVRSSGTTRLYVNGTQQGADYSPSSTENLNFTALDIGRRGDDSNYLNGKVSNVRFVKGTAVYTSSFRPPTEPLTSVTNTKLLCCNNSSVTGTTTGTVTSSGDPTASTDSPFDDPAGFSFGDAGDQNVIKCGSYTTDSNEDATINLGWEPQWVLAKRTDSSTGGDWFIIDSMRGFMNAQDIEANNGGSKYVEPNTSDAEADTSRMGLTSTGFYADQFGSNRSFIYLAIRRSDGYVGKPVELGTGAFNVANYDSTAPAFNANFPVDFAMFRRTTSSYDWRTSARLIQTKYLETNTTDAESIENDYVFDYNDGWNKQTGYANNEVSWLWKRHAGFDVVAYKSPGGDNFAVNHNLGKIPEMMWLKRKSSANYNWTVYHKGLNGGTNPQNYGLHLNSTSAEVDDYGFFADIAPNATTFQVGYDGTTGSSGESYLAMLFASVDGISKVGSYSGTDGSNITITTGFQPRFIMVKKADGAGSWHVFDTVRGMGSGNDPVLMLNNSNAQVTVDYVTPSSTGWQTVGGNLAQGDFIYYAHA